MKVKHWPGKYLEKKSITNQELSESVLLVEDQVEFHARRPPMNVLVVDRIAPMSTEAPQLQNIFNDITRTQFTN